MQSNVSQKETKKFPRKELLPFHTTFSMKRKQLIASFGFASFGIASFGIASFGIASFGIASFDFGDFGPPRK
jgi:hypothetical protein